ncbi:hypothetical protein [Jejuia pallidilutea]|uniref:Uncharacterized protein n=1 Tax=Jejuia pallidilutea TaxID=504487 RepID=A0A090W2E2_9FLAO|nr:hypothetical protein [Jejuia pallidilutea]GAL66216.1 hypothetical protein JCM19301_781 [Jejuia pallidilutea]GAL71180.1 hypothetical protein JCM19302_609 [Jejuia pallidilutea]GAL88241.1 hypothetical protein JCM19538_2604 [Jejuia pallidilutea]
MENGLLILGLIGLLFLSMYGYAYGTVALEKMRLKKQQQEIERLEAIKKEERLQRQKAREEKLAKLKKRSDEIRLELNRLEKVNLQRATKDQKKVEKMKERIEQKQQAAS